MARRDYIFTLRFAADDDTDAHEFGKLIERAIVNEISTRETLGRHLALGRVESAMLTRDFVARPLPERL